MSSEFLSLFLIYLNRNEWGIFLRKKIFMLLILTFLMVGCGGRGRLHQPARGLYTRAPALEPEPTAELHQPVRELNVPEPEPIIELEILEPNFLTITGVITNFEGPVNDDGSIPWYVDWFRFEIETEDGDPAVIIGVHYTAFMLGSTPAVGMRVTGYISHDSPVFTEDGEIVYIAVAIIGGEPDVVVCSFREAGNTYISNDTSFRFITGENTEIKHAMWANPWTYSTFWWERIKGFIDFAVFYETNTDGIAVATTVVLLDHDIPHVSNTIGMYSPATVPGSWWIEDIPEQINLSVTDHIFTMDDFEQLNLPIFVNGRVGVQRIDQPAIIGANGIIMVPFRPIFQYVGFGNYAELDLVGGLNFGGGGAGSENSYYRVGEAKVWHLVVSATLDVPPIIVEGVIYVPLQTFFNGYAPFTGAWIFEDRIEIFGESQSRYGPYYEWSWFADTSNADVVAAMPVMVNGMQVDAVAELLDYCDIRVPASPILKALGIQWDGAEDEMLGIEYLALDIRHLTEIRLSVAAIVHEGKILIYELENLLGAVFSQG